MAGRATLQTAQSGRGFAGRGAGVVEGFSTLGGGDEPSPDAGTILSRVDIVSFASNRR